MRTSRLGEILTPWKHAKTAASLSGCPAEIIAAGPQVAVKSVACLQADIPRQAKETQARNAWAHSDLMLPRWAREGESSRRSLSESSQIATGVWVLWAQVPVAFKSQYFGGPVSQMWILKAGLPDVLCLNPSVLREKLRWCVLFLLWDRGCPARGGISGEIRPLPCSSQWACCPLLSARCC